MPGQQLLAYFPWHVNIRSLRRAYKHSHIIFERLDDPELPLRPGASSTAAQWNQDHRTRKLSRRPLEILSTVVPGFVQMHN